MTQDAFDHGDRSRVVERRRQHAAKVLADLDGATAASLDGFPRELPVEALVACGQCLLYAGVPALLPFPAWLAAAAVHHLVTLLVGATQDANDLPGMVTGSLPEEAEDAAAGLVHTRMDSWAAMLQLDEVALETSGDPAVAAELDRAVDEFDVALDQFDRALFARQPELGTLTGTNLFANLRSMLAPAHRDPLPWWLDGRLEDDAIDVLVDQLMFVRPTGGAVLPDQPTFGALRRQLQHTYAAAAATAPEGGTVLSPSVLQWQSPGDGCVARLVSPATKLVLPQRVVVSFWDAYARPAFGLAGKRCTLAGIEAAIERRTIEGADIVTASFPGDAFFGSMARHLDSDPLTLVVGEPGIAWAMGKP